MKEKDFQVLFSAWAKNNKIKIVEQFGKAGLFELKISKERSIRFDDVKPHQIEALTEAKTIGCYHKINDMPFIKDNPKYRFTNKKPADCFFCADGFGFVVVFFYKKGQRKNDREMIFIDVDEWLKEWKIAEAGGQKSVREEYLRIIGKVEKVGDYEVVAKV